MPQGSRILLVLVLQELPRGQKTNHRISKRTTDSKASSTYNLLFVKTKHNAIGKTQLNIVLIAVRDQLLTLIDWSRGEQ